MSDLEEAITLTPVGAGRWAAFADPRYESISGMFGGWTAAVVLRAVMANAAEDAAPAAMTTNFVGRIDPGSDVLVHVLAVGGGRSIQHWRAEVVGAQDGSSTLAHAMLVTSVRRPTAGHTQPAMPECPEPEELAEFNPPGAQGARMQLRPVHGHPPFGRGDTSSSAWTREKTGRRVDYLQLAYLADSYAPRSFFWSDGPGMTATMSLSVYFLGTRTEVDAVGDDYVLNEATGTRGADAMSGQQARLWSRQGALLATTEQLCWYR